MGKLDVFSISGVEMWFWSADHLPPHFHAKRPGEWEIRVYFLESQESHLAFDVRWGAGPNGKMRGALAELVVKHREALYEEWCRKTGLED